MISRHLQETSQLLNHDPWGGDIVQINSPWHKVLPRKIWAWYKRFKGGLGGEKNGHVWLKIMTSRPYFIIPHKCRGSISVHVAWTKKGLFCPSYTGVRTNCRYTCACMHVNQTSCLDIPCRHTGPYPVHPNDAQPGIPLVDAERWSQML